MRRLRRRCLPLLLLVTAATLGTSAVTPRSRDSLDLLDQGWGGKDDYYLAANGLSCQKCPPGTYVAEECKEQNSSGKCVPCEDGEYMEYPNALRQCRDCRKCREDQVEVNGCQPIRNTVCACRNGTFCPPDHPCEMCQKCQPRCPEGQVVLKPCTPYSDLQCGPATDTGSTHSWTIPVAVAVAILLLAAICFWWCCCRSPGDGRRSSRRPYEMVTSMFRKLPWYTGTEDNSINERLQSQQQHPVAEPLVPQSGSERPKRKLVPAPETDPKRVLRLSFYIFAKKIPMDNWRRFGRNLHLEENDIVLDRTEDAFYQMLYKWQNREGTKASVNTLLETLDQLHLGGVAEDISSTLVNNGTFQYETS
ncbi:tumor necrosis factor receptor superfamily member 10B [Corvus hawaiiensis]|uniref:tumor necrosis factor receptor superfamily member 10B n=1 Tax=Corvus hawaiiensis TaxID=134902 RepID=UPI002018F6F3|nr:tumor necrosis factor receptor superfamily member 10B [Corvus hawaiiensis]